MLENIYLAGKTVATPYGTVIFNDQGVSDNLPEDSQKELANKVPSYTFVATKVEKPVEAPKEPVEDDKEKVEEVAEKEAETPIEAPKEPVKAKETKPKATKPKATKTASKTATKK